MTTMRFGKWKGTELENRAADVSSVGSQGSEDP